MVDAYEVTGKSGRTHVLTPSELREEWEACKEWGYTTENFETWLRRLELQDKVKPIMKWKIIGSNEYGIKYKCAFCGAEIYNIKVSSTCARCGH